jgi:phage repressor protein C with HTH and peptisase S24 domain
MSTDKLTEHRGLAPGARDRLAEAVKRAGGQSAVARRLGISRQNLNNVLRTGQGVGAVRLAAIASEVGVSVDYVLNGPEPEGERVSEVVRIPIVEVEAAAGFGRRASEEPATVDSLTMPLSVARSLGVVEKLRTVIVRGDSQQPELNDGDLVMYDASQPYRAPGMYVLVLDGELVVKRLQRTKDGVAVLSSNPAFPPIDVSADEADDRVRVLGKVVWSGRKW